MTPGPAHLDRGRPFATVHGEARYRFEQGGKMFDHRGVEILDDSVARDAVDYEPINDALPVSQELHSAAAVRMRRTRERRRAGIIAVVQVEITQQDLDQLVARNLLSSDEADDRRKIAAAVQRALEYWCQT